jgi:hypothetical protein
VELEARVEVTAQQEVDRAEDRVRVPALPRRVLEVVAEQLELLRAGAARRAAWLDRVGGRSQNR